MYFQTGDFFRDNIPEANLYILSRVLHDWSEEKVHILLSKIFAVCKPGKTCDFSFNTVNTMFNGSLKSFCCQQS